MTKIPNKVRILLCGYGHLGLALLQGLLKHLEECEIVAVFQWSTCILSGKSASWDPVEREFTKRIREAGLQAITGEGINSYAFATLLETLKPDVLLVGSWGEIIKPHVIQYPNLIIINCHPSKLPAHRGANPFVSVLRHGEKETGVTFHWVAPKLDAGPIILQQTIPLDLASDTGASVVNRCATVAEILVEELFTLLKRHFHENVPLPAIEQNDSQKSYYPQIKIEDGLLNWEDTEEAMSLQIRALYPWLACYSLLEGRTPIFFYDPQFITPDETVQTGLLAGTIRSFNDGVLEIAVSDPNKVLRISVFQCATPNLSRFWPIPLSRLIGLWLLRPGKRFRAAPK